MININDIISHWRINKSIPRVIILDKFDYVLRQNFFNLLLSSMNFNLYSFNSSVDNIRNMIKLSNNIISPTIFYIADDKDISIQSQNALLKLAEEPTNMLYIVINTSDAREMLMTLISRSTVLTAREDYTSSIGTTCLVNSIIDNINNKSGIDMYKDCNRLKAKEIDEDKIDCVEVYNEIKKQLLNINCKLDNIINSINKTNKIMNVNNTNKKMALEVLLNDILNEVKNNG